MGVGLQREWIGPSVRHELGRRHGVWEKLHEGLDSDLVIVLPQMYLDNRHLYDMLWAQIFIISDNHPDGALDWCWEGAYSRIRDRHKNVRIVAKALIVRLRLPWNRVQEQWLINAGQLSDSQDDYEVLDTYIKVVHKNSLNEEPFHIDKSRFEINRDLYEVVEILYLVTWVFNKKNKASFLGIDPSKTHRVIAR